MRLSFAVEPDARWRQLARHAGAALAELAVVAALGAMVSITSGWSLLSACGAVALVFYPIATGVTGRVLSAGRLRSILRVHPAGTAPPAMEAAEPVPLYLVLRQPVKSPLVVSVGADEFHQPRTATR